MKLVIFIPMLVCIASLIRRGAPRALLDVCLPVLLLAPTYFYWKMDGFPGVDFVLAVFMPLGAVLMASAVGRWQFTRSDLWLALYICSCAYADLHLGQTSLAKYRLFNVLFTALVPYMAGKLLIEGGIGRLAVARRTVLLLGLSCVVALPEAILKFNLFVREGMHAFPDQWPGFATEMRWGLGRVAGPYGSPELFGLILSAGLLLLLWLLKRHSLVESQREEGWSSSRVVTIALLPLFLGTMVLTISRGPWLGAILGLLVASTGRARRVGRAALLVTVFTVLVAVPTYQMVKSYSSGPRRDYGSERETAQYRQELIKNYLPLARQGGLWGWGTFYPILGGQTSIDNEFLRVFVAQGYVGLVSYVLLILEAAYLLLIVGFKAKMREERHFYFTMLGIVLGWTLTLSTVYMGAQTYELFFLMMGWTQALRQTPRAMRVEEQEVEPELLQLNRIYT